jgi:predicted GTPase
MLKNRYPTSAGSVVFDLSGSLQRRDAVRGYFQRAAKRGERFFLLSPTRVRDTLHRPQLSIAGRGLQLGPQQVEGSIELLIPQSGSDLLDWFLTGLPKDAREKHYRKRDCEHGS